MSGDNYRLCWPEWCESLFDLPEDFMVAMDHALYMLKMLNSEHLTSEERPPRWMWHLSHEMEKWFAEVTLNRKNKAEGRDDDEIEWGVEGEDYIEMDVPDDGIWGGMKQLND